MLEFLKIAGAYAAGVISAVFFVVGFLARRNVEATGSIVGKPKVLEPFLNTSREALIEQRRAEALDEIDLRPYENE